MDIHLRRSGASEPKQDLANRPFLLRRAGHLLKRCDMGPSLRSDQDFVQSLIQALKNEEVKQGFAKLMKPNKDEIVNIISKEMKEHVSKLDSKIKSFKSELENKYTHIEREIKANEEKTKALEMENESLKATVKQHQKFLEEIEDDRRGRNVVVLGLEEDTNESDVDRCKTLFDLIGANVEIEHSFRLGKNVNGRRPLKIILKSRAQRTNLLHKAKQLKDNEHTKKIFVKKDEHPLVRNEMKRLNDAFKNEKAKAENQGRQVIFDRKQRQITVDGEIIDEYQPFMNGEQNRR